MDQKLLIILWMAATCVVGGRVSILDERGFETYGAEQIGPIDNYTCVNNGAFEVDACELFVTCWEGEAILHRCTEVMLFDLRYRGCEIAEYVDCGDRIRPPTYPGTVTPKVTTRQPTTVDPTAPTVSSTAGPNDTFACPNNGVFPHKTKCEYYWSCYQNDATLIHCENEYLFDLRYNGCNFPEYVDCQDRERPPGAPSTVTPPEGTKPTGTTPSQGSTVSGGTPGPTTPSTEFQCPDRNGMFPDPASCSSFYECVSDVPVHHECPDGLHFNPELGICDWPESAGCQQRF